MANVLNCNPANGNIITENSARIVFYGMEDSISNIYLSARKNASGVTAKSSDFSHLVINGITLEKSYCKSFYEALWYQFFNENPDLIEKIRSYDGYYDGLPDKAYNSTARVFRMLKDFGMNGLYSNIKPFLSELRAKTPKKTENIVKDIETNTLENDTEEAKLTNLLDRFNNMDLVVKRLVNKYYLVIEKSELINCEELKSFEDKDVLRQLISVRYDEKEGNCSKAYINNLLTSIRNKYTKKEESKDNKIILE